MAAANGAASGALQFDLSVLRSVRCCTCARNRSFHFSSTRTAHCQYSTVCGHSELRSGNEDIAASVVRAGIRPLAQRRSSMGIPPRGEQPSRGAHQRCGVLGHGLRRWVYDGHSDGHVPLPRMVHGHDRNVFDVVLLHRGRHEHRARRRRVQLDGDVVLVQLHNVS